MSDIVVVTHIFENCSKSKSLRVCVYVCEIFCFTVYCTYIGLHELYPKDLKEFLDLLCRFVDRVIRRIEYSQ